MTRRAYLLTFLLVLALATLVPGQTFTTLYSFKIGSDGWYPQAGVIEDADGNLYGTTAGGGGNDGEGVVYKLSAAGTETVLHTFSFIPDGDYPVAPVTLDRTGNIYGTTYYGGSYNYGAVFKIDTAENETVLYSFIGRSDGCRPYQGLVRDRAGNLFGTTSSCGASNKGTIFKIDDAGNFTLLHSFAGGSADGAHPFYGHLAMDTSGNLFGVTSGGGLNNYGVLYRLSKGGTFSLLYRFKAPGTCSPLGSVVRDKAGNFYGTSEYCGSRNEFGTIWKVSKTGKETILHSFAGGALDGCWPLAGVTRDPAGNLYGVTEYCGANNYGTLYELSAIGRLSLLHSFDDSDSDGAYPVGEVTRATKGMLFGTTSGNTSGSPSSGSVWRYVP